MSSPKSIHIRGEQKCLWKFLPISARGSLPPEWMLPCLLQFCDIASNNDFLPETDHHKLCCVEHVPDLPDGAAVQSLPEHLTVLRRHCDNKPTGRLGVEQRIVAYNIGLMRHGTQVEVHAETPSEGHLGGGNTETPIR